MHIQDLHGRFNGEVVIVVGTGPSLRAFPLDFIKGAPSIGLNQAWRLFQPTFMLTGHPELYQDYRKTKGAPVLQWIVKKKPPMAHLTVDDPDLYVFHTSSDLIAVTTRPNDTLYVGEGIQCTALDLAARMGAKAVFLVGCDGCSLSGDYHAHDQHVRWLGMKPNDQYALYRKRTAQVRTILRTKYNIPVLTLSPFVGVGHADEDYARLRSELHLPALPKPKDISPYIRKKPPHG